ncbi:hypothetical protein HY641_02105 [Candidatus Woesearchaeota archaeon]|nr:hypothetical protein [Candidatus Woesearchaeota archaeon]
MKNLIILAVMALMVSQSVFANHDSYGKEYGADSYYQSSRGRVAESLSRDYSIDRTETNNVFSFVNRDASASQSATSSGSASGSLIGAQAGSQSGNFNGNANVNQNGAYNSNYADSYSNAYPPYSNRGFGYGGVAASYGNYYNPYTYPYGYYPTSGSSNGNVDQNQNFNQFGNINKNANQQYNDAYSAVANQGYNTNFNTQSQSSTRESSGTNATHVLSERIKDAVKVEKLYQDVDYEGRYNSANRYYDAGYDQYYSPQEYRSTKYVYDGRYDDYRYNPSYDRYSRSYPFSTSKYDGTRSRVYDDGLVIRY